MATQAAAFLSGARRGRLTVIIFSIVAVLSALDPAISFWQIALIKRIESGGDWTEHEVNVSDGVAEAFAVMYAATYLAGVIFFLMWFHRVRANLPALGATDARWSPGWAVGSWFIPVMNLFRPYQIMSEVWRASDPLETPPAWRERPVSPLLGWWWALWLAGGVISFGGGLLQGSLWVLESGLITLLSVVASVLSVLCTILFLRIIRRITAAQSAIGPASVFA